MPNKFLIRTEVSVYKKYSCYKETGHQSWKTPLYFMLPGRLKSRESVAIDIIHEQHDQMMLSKVRACEAEVP